MRFADTNSRDSIRSRDSARGVARPKRSCEGSLAHCGLRIGTRAKRSLQGVRRGPQRRVSRWGAPQHPLCRWLQCDRLPPCDGGLRLGPFPPLSLRRDPETRGRELGNVRRKASARFLHSTSPSLRLGVSARDRRIRCSEEGGFQTRPCERGSAFIRSATPRLSANPAVTLKIHAWAKGPPSCRPALRALCLCGEQLFLPSFLPAFLPSSRRPCVSARGKWSVVAAGFHACALFRDPWLVTRDS